MEEIKFRKGNAETLPSTRDDNTIYYTTGDTESDGVMYLGNYEWNSRVDESLNENSKNPIANSAITKAILENEYVVAKSFSAIKDNVGLDENLSFDFSRTTATYVSGASDAIDAILKLDEAIGGVNENIPTNISELNNDEGYITMDDIVIDDELSETSPNLVSNSAITKGITDVEKLLAYTDAAIKDSVGLNENLEFDFSETDTKIVKYAENITDAIVLLDNEFGNVTIDTELLEDSSNAIANSAVTKTILDNELVDSKSFAAIEKSVGLDENLDIDFSTLQVNYTSGASDIVNAIEILDGMMGIAVETKADKTSVPTDYIGSKEKTQLMNSIGLDENLSHDFSKDTDSHYTNTATDVVNALGKLDSAIYNTTTKVDTINGNYLKNDAYDIGGWNNKYSKFIGNKNGYLGEYYYDTSRSDVYLYSKNSSTDFSKITLTPLSAVTTNENVSPGSAYSGYPTKFKNEQIIGGDRINLSSFVSGHTQINGNWYAYKERSYANFNGTSFNIESYYDRYSNVSDAILQQTSTTLQTQGPSYFCINTYNRLANDNSDLYDGSASIVQRGNYKDIENGEKSSNEQVFRIIFDAWHWSETLELYGDYFAIIDPFGGFKFFNCDDEELKLLHVTKETIDGTLEFTDEDDFKYETLNSQSQTDICLRVQKTKEDDNAYSSTIQTDETSETFVVSESIKEGDDYANKVNTVKLTSTNFTLNDKQIATEEYFDNKQVVISSDDFNESLMEDGTIYFIYD